MEAFPEIRSKVEQTRRKSEEFMGHLSDQEVQKVYKECFNIPKIELHSYIGGCVRPETFLELAQKKNVSIDNLDFYNVDLKMAFEIFKLGPKLFTDLATLDRIVREIIHDYAKFNTIYLELRTTPKDFEASTKEEYIDTLVKAMKEEEENNPRIKVRLLLSINRSQSLEAAKELVDLAIKFQSKGEKYIVGVEISGDPRQGQFSDFRAELQRARDSGLKTTLHCGETQDQAAENKEMIAFKPDRLGHCCYLSSEDIKQVVKYNIPVELCPTSNMATVQSGTVAMLQHLREFHVLKHNLIICCDDTSKCSKDQLAGVVVFGTNQMNELFEYAKAVGADTKDLKELLLRNVDAIFDEEAKDWTRATIEKFNC